MMSDEEEMALEQSAIILERLGMTYASETLRRAVGRKINEYVDKAIEAGIADERRKLTKELAIEYMSKVLRLRYEYDIIYGSSEKIMKGD